MASLQVRELPEELYLKLCQAAERDHRSLAQEAVAILEKALNADPSPKSRRQELLAEIKSYTSDIKPEELDSPADLLREDRER
ncbi:MAG: FitA-like ribbon-helix-helix domain-containing protein [Planctomycetota bacterium]|jgi:plasmid stability protein